MVSSKRVVPSAVVDALVDEAEQLWREFRARVEARFTSFIPCDYALAHEALVPLAHERGGAFIELGSGAGVVTILADLLGFDAYGIELDPWLVERSIDLAERHGSDATFIHGSFVPEAMRDDVEHQPADFLCEVDGQDAFAEIGMELGDFDVIYDYHWPDQHALHNDMLMRYGRPGTVVLRFSDEEGFVATTL